MSLLHGSTGTVTGRSFPLDCPALDEDDDDGAFAAAPGFAAVVACFAAVAPAIGFGSVVTAKAGLSAASVAAAAAVAGFSAAAVAAIASVAGFTAAATVLAGFSSADFAASFAATADATGTNDDGNDNCCVELFSFDDDLLGMFLN